MDTIRKGATVAIGALLALSLMGFAPVPSTTTYHGLYLFPEDGSQIKTSAAHKVYQVAELPTVRISSLNDAKLRYRAAIAVLDSHGKIVYFRDVTEPKAVNAFGRYIEVKHSYRSLRALESRLDLIIKHAVNHY